MNASLITITVGLMIRSNESTQRSLQMPVKCNENRQPHTERVTSCCSSNNFKSIIIVIMLSCSACSYNVYEEYKCVGKYNVDWILWDLVSCMQYTHAHKPKRTHTGPLYARVFESRSGLRAL